MKTGLHGLASKIDEVQGKAAEDLTELAHKTDAAWSQASSVASDLSARLTEAERQQAAAQAAAEQAQALSDAALKETATVRRDEQIAHAKLEADLQTAALQSKSTADRAALQAAQAMADARSANVEVPRLDATLLSLQAELHAMKVASQQAQERALRLESELSAAQDRLGAAERKAMQVEKRHSALQKRMDDWDAFDPDLHEALHASMTPPATGIAIPAGSEATVQSAQQVQPQAQSGIGGPTGPSTSRLQPAVTSFEQLAAQRQAQGYGTLPLFPSVQSAQSPVQQAQQTVFQTQPPPVMNDGGAVDSTGGSELSFAPPGAGGSSSGPNGGGTPPPFPSFHAGFHRQLTLGQAFTFQVKPKDPPMFRGRVDEDVITWTAKVQDFFYLTDAGDVQQVAYAATLLQDAASDWWHSLLKTCGGMRPRNFVEFADLLG